MPNFAKIDFLQAKKAFSSNPLERLGNFFPLAD